MQGQLFTQDFLLRGIRETPPCEALTEDGLAAFKAALIGFTTLDALFMHLYGLNEDDAGYILDSFPIVREHDGAAFGDYRTKSLILVGMRRIAEGVLGVAATSHTVFVEHQRVRVLRNIEAEGYRLDKDMVGTVVSVYGGGIAYAVEFAALESGMAVVTIKAADVAEAV